MKESVSTGLSWIRANAKRLGITSRTKSNGISVEESDNIMPLYEETLFAKSDLHVHFPAAAIPKDGPSAGITVTTAMVSLYTNRRVKTDVAMTGEISL